MFIVCLFSLNLEAWVELQFYYRSFLSIDSKRDKQHCIRFLLSFIFLQTSFDVPNEQIETTINKLLDRNITYKKSHSSHNFKKNLNVSRTY